MKEVLSVTPEQSEEIIQQHEPSEEGRAGNLITIDGFTDFLMSTKGSLFNLTHCSVSQILSYPSSPPSFMHTERDAGNRVQSRVPGPFGYQSQVLGLQPGRGSRDRSRAG